ncbi:Protein GrpE [Acetobacteraceae bacterium EV16G]|uniref:Protein GrpE n=1 Tax=Sorlinia euscelidii TaxID=3081148 RepID=A0ABU7TZL0_9PROT
MTKENANPDELTPEGETPHEGVSSENIAADTAETGSADDNEARIQEFKDKWMRAEAELQNYRARSKRDIDDARQYAIQKFARDVVEAAENLQRGLASLPPRSENDDPLLSKLREGLESTERSFISILERHGIACDHPKGKNFDANLHQAMAETESAEHAPGTVVESWTPTWTLHGRLLKPAMVVVSKGKSEGGEST